MSTRTAVRSTLAILAALLLCASAHAQLFRAYLAPTGLDSNPCTLPSPCRLLPAALAAVASGGEIWMLDSANYNAATVNITKSVTILAVPGAVGSVLATGGNAINIATPGVRVTLRNLVIVPFPGGGGANGIVMTAGDSLTVENSLVANLPATGIYVATAAKVQVTDTTIRGNAFPGVYLGLGASGGIARSIISGNGEQGVRVENGGRAFISASSIVGNDFGGVEIRGTALSVSTASITDSVITSSSFGVAALALHADAIVRAVVTRSTIGSTGYALLSQTGGAGSALITVSASTLAHNDFAYAQNGNGSVIKSLGNNHMQDNLNPPSGDLTPAALQ